MTPMPLDITETDTVFSFDNELTVASLTIASNVYNSG
jgi:hypothetical protein